MQTEKDNRCIRLWPSIRFYKTTKSAFVIPRSFLGDRLLGKKSAAVSKRCASHLSITHTVCEMTSDVVPYCGFEGIWRATRTKGMAEVEACIIGYAFCNDMSL